MIFEIQDIVAIRDHSASVHFLHIHKPNKEPIEILLGDSNNLWGSPDSKIIDESEKANFFDNNGNFHQQFKATYSTAVYLEIEHNYILEDLELKDSNISNNLFITSFDRSKNPRLIYAFFLLPGQVLNLLGKKVKDRIISSHIITSPNDLRLRGMLLNRSESDYEISFGQDDLLTANQFAVYLKMNLRTFQNKLSKGEILAGKKIGGSIRWRFKDILNWIESLPKV